MTSLFLLAFGVIVLLAVMDLWVGVTNDAVNFLNSAIGAQVARRRTILWVAAAGVLFGALFSSGMMEVARKGVFDPGAFRDASGAVNITLILALYLGVMAADVVMLDMFNTFGLPTSTTVSIVSELVGASMAIAFWMNGGSVSHAVAVINKGTVLGIYTGIFLSILVAFFGSAIVMYLMRILFGHDLERSFAWIGWFWTGVSFASMTYFVLFKGLKHATFMNPELVQAMHAHIRGILGAVFLVSAALAVVFRRRYRAIFTAIILSGTCSLGMAFSGNDLVNFIGPTVAAGQALFVEGVDLTGKVPTPEWALLLAGLVMVWALWHSKKAKTVTDTEVRLAAGGRMEQRFSSVAFARWAVEMAARLFHVVKTVTPAGVREACHQRTDPTPHYDDNTPPYDLLRASVNLTVASIIISIGTANKLPLSTTYITFMVAMGASLADRTWDSQSAASRVTGILAVVGGWLMTGFLAAAGAFVMSSAIYLLGLKLGVLVVMAVVAAWLIKMSSTHRKRFGGRETAMDFVAPAPVPAREASPIQAARETRLSR